LFYQSFNPGFIKRRTNRQLNLTDISAWQSHLLNEQNGAGIDLLARHIKYLLHILKSRSRISMSYSPMAQTGAAILSFP
jgi:hypothetical protein